MSDLCGDCSLPLPPLPPYPFGHKNRFLWYHWITVPLFALLLLPLRLVCLGFVLAVAFVVSLVSQIGQQPNQPLSPWRRSVANSVLFRLANAGSFIGGFAKVTISGRRADVAAAPVLVAAPHTSVIDVVAYFCRPPLLAPVTKAAGNFFYKKMLPAGEAVVVNRRRGKAGVADEISRRARSGGQYQQIMIFPEGTCTNGSVLINFKTGAFTAGTPVQPVLVFHKDPLQLQCWAADGPGLFNIVFRLGTRLYSELHLEFLPVYRPSDAEVRDPKLFANNVRAVMASRLQLAVTDNSYADVLLLKLAKRHRLPNRPALLAFSRARKKLPMDCDALLLLLRRMSDGRCARAGCPHQLCSCLGAALCSQLRQACQLFDRRRDGSVDFREFAIAAALTGWPTGDHRAAFHTALTQMAHSGEVTHEILLTALRGLLGAAAVDCDVACGCVRFDHCGRASVDACLRCLDNCAEFNKLLLLHKELSSLMP